MDRPIKRLWDIVGRGESLTLQIRLFRLICVTMAGLCLIVIFPINVFQRIPVEINVACVLLGLLGLFFYWRSGRGQHFVLLFIVVFVLMLDAIWYLNAASQGSITYYFYPAMLYPMVMFRGRKRWVTMVALVVNINLLLILEYCYPALTVPFQRPSDRLLDLTSGVTCSWLALVVIMWVVLAGYDWEHEQTTRIARDLAASEENYREVVENSRCVIVRLDRQGRVTFVNRFAEELFGYSRAELLGQSALGTIVPATSLKGEDLAAFLRDVLANPLPYAQNENENICRDGRRLRVNWRNQPIYDERGQLRELLCVGTDVTERAALMERLQLTQKTVDAAAEQIVWTDERGRILYANNATVETLGYTAEELKQLTVHDIDQQFPASLWAEHWEMLLRERSIMLETVHRRKDGSTLPVELTVSRVKVGDAEFTTAFIRDITARKQVEENLERINQQLVEISRQAGMAEIASSVLHNVGNVLNSANVSIDIIAESFRKSRLASLDRLAALVAEQGPNLGRFISEDERGKQIPGFLQTLNQHLALEQQRVHKEVESLQSNLTHIKEIVATQQSYARVLGAVETVNLGDLVEDSLRMNAPGFARRDIHLNREFQPVPPVTVDKHKILQILINLLRNSQHACDDTRQSGREISVRLESRGVDRVAIEVADNGVGIAPENMTRIFNHGFTTRKDGHGFGLHSSALAAKEMGGALSARSEGPGLGATFTLELPLHPPDRSNHNGSLQANS